MTVNVKRSKLAYEDVAFGLSTFTRYSATGAQETVTQIKAEHLPIEDSAGIINAENVEAALAEIKALIDEIDFPEEVQRVYGKITSPWETLYASGEPFLWNVYKSQVPPGVTTPYAGSSAPDGWLLCDGTAYSRKAYAELYAAIGTTFGVGDGATTFNVPDMRSRLPIGAGQGAGLTNRALGNTGGAESVDLSHTHDFAHTHSLSAHTHTLGGHTHGMSDSHTHTGGGHTHSLNTTTVAPDTGTHIIISSGTTQGGGAVSTSTPANQGSTQGPSGGSDGPSTDATGNASPDSTTDSQLSATQTVMNPFVALNYIIKT